MSFRPLTSKDYGAGSFMGNREAEFRNDSEKLARIGEWNNVKKVKCPCCKRTRSATQMPEGAKACLSCTTPRRWAA